MKLALVLLAIVLAGCAAPQKGGIDRTRIDMAPATLFSAQSINGSSSLAAIDGAFYETLSGCSQVLNRFEAQATNLKWAGAIIQLIGGAVGSIWLPAVVAGGDASKSLIAALGGFAGYANTARGTVVNEGLGAAAVLASRASVQAAMERALMRFYSDRDADPPNRAGTATAIAQLKVACLSYYVANPAAQQQ